jgi:hypothetical protein
MNNLDTKVQILVDECKELQKEFSDSANPDIMEIFNRINQIGQELEQLDSHPIRAILSTQSDGYDLSILINGKDTGIEGG